MADDRRYEKPVQELRSAGEVMAEGKGWQTAGAVAADAISHFDAELGRRSPEMKQACISLLGHCDDFVANLSQFSVIPQSDRNGIESLLADLDSDLFGIKWQAVAVEPTFRRIAEARYMERGRRRSGKRSLLFDRDVWDWSASIDAKEVSIRIRQFVVRRASLAGLSLSLVYLAMLCKQLRRALEAISQSRDTEFQDMIACLSLVEGIHATSRHCTSRVDRLFG